MHMSDNFQCIGAYPFEVEYDMRYGTAEEYPEALDSIKQVGLPKKDPRIQMRSAIRRIK